MRILRNNNELFFPIRIARSAMLQAVNDRDAQREEIARQVREFEARGGVIKQGKPLVLHPLRESTRRPIPTTRQASATPKAAYKSGRPENSISLTQAMELLGADANSNHFRQVFQQQYAHLVVYTVRTRKGATIRYFDRAAFEALAAGAAR